MQGAFNVDWDSVLDDPGLDEETSRLYQRGAESAGRPVVAARLEAETGIGPENEAEQEIEPESEPENEAEQEIEPESEPENEDEDEVTELGAGLRMPRGRGRGRGAPAPAPGGPAAPAPRGRGRGRGWGRGAPAPGGSAPAPAPPPGAAPAVAVPPVLPEPQPAEQHFVVNNFRFFVMDGSFGVRPARFGHYIRPYIINGNREAVPFPPPPGYDHSNPPPPRIGRARGSPQIPPSQLCQEGVHYLACGARPEFYEIGREALRRVLENGEERDLEFARKMQA